MKKKRILLFFTIFICVFLLLFFSSSFFIVNKIDLILYEKNAYNSFLQVSSNTYAYNLHGVNSQIGKSIFKIEKSKCIKIFEEENPFYKVLNLEYKFPNKVFVKIIKRQNTFFINSATKVFVLDEDYKIVLIKNLNTFNNENLVEIAGEKNGVKVDYFTFFEIDSSCYYEGYFINEHNLLAKIIKDLPYSLERYNLCGLFSKISFSEGENSVNLVCKTNSNFGVEIVTQNIEKEFNKKFRKVLTAFLTLNSKEKIKTTYGRLIIDDSFNCKFYEN